jgi:spoIIIJ-associated protein
MADSPAPTTSPLELLRELLNELVEALDLDATVEVTLEGETLTGTLEGEDLGLFIGRHGQTIDAVQHLAQRFCQRDSEERLRVIVDAAGYRERRRVALEAQADDAAEDALDLGRPVSLDAMSASERRIVHERLRDREDVITHSEGVEPDRHLVVEPAEAGAQQGQA